MVMNPSLMKQKEIGAILNHTKDIMNLMIMNPYLMKQKKNGLISQDRRENIIKNLIKMIQILICQKETGLILEDILTILMENTINQNSTFLKKLVNLILIIKKDKKIKIGNLEKEKIITKNKNNMMNK